MVQTWKCEMIDLSWQASSSRKTYKPVVLETNAGFTLSVERLNLLLWCGFDGSSRYHVMVTRILQ